MSTFFLALAITLVCAALGWLVYHYLRKFLFTRNMARLVAARNTCDAVVAVLESIPNPLIPRDVRRGLVHILIHQIEVIANINPQHPALARLRQHMLKLNRMPSSLEKAAMRSKQERTHAMAGFDAITKIMFQAAQQQPNERKALDLARATAIFSAQQLAVQNARQSIQDAENVRDYPQALNYAYQAQRLCRSLPPLMGKRLADQVSEDIERLESAQAQNVSNTQLKAART